MKTKVHNITKHTRGKARSKTKKNLRLRRPRAAIVPHAGSYYAGAARKSAFDALANHSITHIIYISAIHDSSGLSPGVYELHKDRSFGSTPNLPRLDRPEHSFDWVEKELRAFFPGVRVFVVTPVRINSQNNIIPWITKYIKNKKSSILLSTTDLTHFGPSHRNKSLKFPERLHKQLVEEDLIQSLVAHPIRLKTIARNVSELDSMCGPYAINLFMRVIKRLGYSGKVTDYYDSNFNEKKLNKYTIPYRRTSEFVSYVSIIFGLDIKQSVLNELDIMMAIGGVKSEISRTLSNSTYDIRLPKWSPFHGLKQGVFVGTSTDGKTNCSYGRYEAGGTGSTADKIVDAAGDCVGDAGHRWKLPYDIDYLDDLNYKIELLDPREEWKGYSGEKVGKHFKVDGKTGVYLELDSGKSATYLPVVSRENKHWTVDEYMRKLTEKAGGTGDDWKKGKIWLYGSGSYTWDSHKQKLIRQ